MIHLPIWAAYLLAFALLSVGACVGVFIAALFCANGRLPNCHHPSSCERGEDGYCGRCHQEMY